MKKILILLLFTWIVWLHSPLPNMKPENIKARAGTGHFYKYTVLDYRALHGTLMLVFANGTKIWTSTSNLAGMYKID